MTIPARRDPAAEALQLAAYRRMAGIYRGFAVAYEPETNPQQPWLYVDFNALNPSIGAAPSYAAARRAVDELLSKETRV